MNDSRIGVAKISGNSLDKCTHCGDVYNTGEFHFCQSVTDIAFENLTKHDSPPTEEITKPERYNKRGKLECWDVILDQEMDFLEGSILKYLWRYKEKNGTADLRKAIVYLEKKIKQIEEK